MGVNQVDLFTSTLDEPVFLNYPVEKNTPCLHEGCAELRPWAPNVPPFSHTRGSVLQGISKIHPLRHHPSVHSVPIRSPDQYRTTQLQATRTIPAGADVVPNGGSNNSTWGDSGHSLIDTRYLGQRIDMPGCFIRSSCLYELARIDSTTVFHDTDMVDGVPSQRRHRKVHGKYFLSSENGTSGNGFDFPQSMLHDQEVSSPASTDKQILGLSASFCPHKISSGSVEIQRVWPGGPWDCPQPSPELMKGRLTTSFYRKGISLEQPITENGGRYQCNICGKGFVQLQGLKRHHLEKHEPRLCPHCHTFKWARPYLLKKHVMEAHPGLDPEATTLDAARRGRRKSLTATRHRMHLHASHSDSTTVSNLSPATLPLDPHRENFLTMGNVRGIEHCGSR